MANADAPRGFRPYQKEGKCYCSREYAKTAATEILEGAALKRVAGGTVEPAAAGDQVVGIATRYSPATESVVDVLDDPEATYICQVSNGNFSSPADHGQNANLAVGTAQGPDSRRSGNTVDYATLGVGATLQFKIIDIAPQINQEPNDGDGSEANTDILVKVNHAERAAGTAGI